MKQEKLVFKVNKSYQKHVSHENGSCGAQLTLKKLPFSEIMQDSCVPDLADRRSVVTFLTIELFFV